MVGNNCSHMRLYHIIKQSHMATVITYHTVIQSPMTAVITYHTVQQSSMTTVITYHTVQQSPMTTVITYHTVQQSPRWRTASEARLKHFDRGLWADKAPRDCRVKCAKSSILGVS
jgi:hypothetical protein